MAKHYRYAIKNKDGKYYTLISGQVDTQTDPFYYDAGISNFRDQGIKVKRNLQRGGFTTTYMDSEYQFVNPEGDPRNHLHKVVKHIFFRYGPDAKATLIVERMTNYQRKTYEVDYECELEFGTAINSRDNISVGLFEGGVAARMASWAGTKIPIPITSANQKTVKCLPIRLYGKAQYLTFHQNAAANSDTQGNQSGGIQFWPSVMQYHEQYAEVNTSDNLRPVDYAPEIAPRAYIRGQQILSSATGVWSSTPGAAQNYLFRTNVALENVRVRLTLPSFVKNNDPSNPLTIRASIWSYNEAVPGSEAQESFYSVLTLPAAGQSNHTFTIDNINDLITLPANYRLYILLDASHDDYEWNWERDKKLEITYEYFSSEFQVKGIPIFEAAKELVNQMTDGQGVLTSNLLTQDITYSEGIDCKPANIIFVSGESIRGINNPEVKISWNDVVKALDLWFCAGWDVIDNKVVIERRKEFMKEGPDDHIAHLGEAIEWEVAFANDMAYNEIHLGYPEQEYDNLNGREEFNTTLKMRTYPEQMRVGGSESGDAKDLVSFIRTDTFGIYSLWQKYTLQNETDTDSLEDNAVFALQHSPVVTAGVHTALYPSEINSSYIVQGVADANKMLNTGLTPKTCLYRRMYWDISHFYDSDPFTNAYKLEFLTVDKNTAFKKQISTSYFITEAGDEDMELTMLLTGQQRLFYPYYLTVEVEAPDNFRALWEAKRYGYFTVDIEGVTYKGFPIEAAEKNAIPKTHSYKLLLTASDHPARFI